MDKEEVKKEMREGAEKTKLQADLLYGFYNRKQLAETEQKRADAWGAKMQEYSELSKYNQELIDYLSE